MKIVIVYETQYGNTEHLARAMADTLTPEHEVRVVRAADATELTGEGVDLLLVGAPTHIHGWQLPGREFLKGLPQHGFGGVPAAAFDTRLPGATWKTGAAAGTIADYLAGAGCRVLTHGESFIVEGGEGPLSAGEEQRAMAWARDLVAGMAVAATA